MAFTTELIELLQHDLRNGLDKLYAKIKKFNDSFKDTPFISREMVRELGLVEEFEFMRKLHTRATGGKFSFQEKGVSLCKKWSQRGLDVKESSRKRESSPSSKPSKRCKPTVQGVGGGCAGPVEYDDEEEEAESDEENDLGWKTRFGTLAGAIEVHGVVNLKQGTDSKFFDHLINRTSLSYGPIVEIGSTREKSLKNCIVLKLTRESGTPIRAEATMKGSKARVLNQYEKMGDKGKGKAKAKGIWYIDRSMLTPAKKILFDSIRQVYLEKSFSGWVRRKDVCPAEYDRQKKQPWKGNFSHLVDKASRKRSEEEIDSHVGVGVWVRNDRAGPDGWVCVL